jgi:hypothetical protein
MSVYVCGIDEKVTDAVELARTLDEMSTYVDAIVMLP